MAQFFNPREAWMAHKYTAELTITQAVAERSHGGVIYYFCHIHSKMSGRIVINNVDGSRYSPPLNPTELSLYSPVVLSTFDESCGTTAVVNYSDAQGGMACDERFVPGAIDTTFDHCLQVCRWGRVHVRAGPTFDSALRARVLCGCCQCDAMRLL